MLREAKLDLIQSSHQRHFLPHHSRLTHQQLPCLQDVAVHSFKHYPNDEQTPVEICILLAFRTGPWRPENSRAVAKPQHPNWSVLRPASLPESCLAPELLAWWQIRKRTFKRNQSWNPLWGGLFWGLYCIQDSRPHFSCFPKNRPWNINEVKHTAACGLFFKPTHSRRTNRQKVAWIKSGTYRT